MRKMLVGFIKRYHLWWYALTVIFYAVMIPLTVWVFPATTLLLSIVVLFSGFTASVASLASALMSAEQDETMRETLPTDEST